MITQVGQLLLARLAELFLLVRRVRFSSPEDGSFIILRELVLGAEDCVGREAWDAVAATALSNNGPKSDDGGDARSKRTPRPVPPGFVKFDIAKNSTRSFCIGVPDNNTRFRQASDASAWDVCASSFFRR